MELEELDTNLVEIEEFKCRTCLFSSEKTMCFTQINQLCSPEKSVKDILIQMVPQMETTVSDEDRVCRSCLKTILAYVRFVDKCLDIEAQLSQENEELAKQLEEGETIEAVQIPEQADLDNAQIVENIEIVVENDLQSHFKPTKIIGERKQRTTSDHVYIKTECIDPDEEGILPLEITDEAGSIDDGGDLSTDAVYEEYEGAFSNHEMITEDGELIEAEDGEIIEGVGEYLDSDMETVQIKQELHDDDTSNMIEVYMDPECVICEVCGKFIRDQESLKRHLQTHNSTIYKCSECPKAFRARHLLRNHINSVHDPDTVGIRLQCSKCPKLFKNKPALAAHYKLKHEEGTSYTCQICSEVFARADYLKKHLQTHTGDNPKKNRTSTVPGKFLRFKNTGTDDPLPCKICGKFYNGINKLKVHLQTHVVVKRYQCEYCSLTYKRWPSLKRHEKTHTESDENFHRCNVCWKRLKTEEELKLHMASHGNPKYQCHICDEQFHRKYLFDNHYLLEHATPEDLENSKKEIIYDTLLELSAKLE